MRLPSVPPAHPAIKVKFEGMRDQLWRGAINRNPAADAQSCLGASGKDLQSLAIRYVKYVVRHHRHVIGLMILDRFDVDRNLVPVPGGGIRAHDHSRITLREAGQAMRQSKGLQHRDLSPMALQDIPSRLRHTETKHVDDAGTRNAHYVTAIDRDIEDRIPRFQQVL